MKITVQVVSVLGFALFLAVFSATFVSQVRLEESAKAFIAHQIEKEVNKHLDAVEELGGFVGKVGFLKKKQEEKKEELLTKIREELPKRIAVVLSKKFELNEVEEKVAEGAVKAVMLAMVAHAEEAMRKLDDLIRSKYKEILSNLLRDIRIFSGGNFVLFLFAFLLTLIKKEEWRLVALPTALLVLATLVASGFYIFGQDWFYTIIYNAYFGYGYLVFVAIIFAILCDIGLNRARVLRAIAESLPYEWT